MISASAFSISRVRLHRVDVGLLLDGDDDRRRAHIAGLAALGTRTEAHLRDLAQMDGPIAGLATDQVPQIVQLQGAPDVADQELRAYWSVKPPPVLPPNCASAFSSCS